MVNNDVTLPELEHPFSKYPMEMDKYFQDNEVVIKIIPEELVDGIEPHYQNFKITSTKEFEQYLDAEIAFWAKHDPQGKFNAITHKDRLDSAKRHFNDALGYYKNESIANGINALGGSVTALSKGVLYSCTLLAKFLITKTTYSDSFKIGLRLALEKAKHKSSISTSEMDGYIAAHEFLRCVNDSNIFAIEEIEQYRLNAVETNTNFAELNSKYTPAFHEHEQQIQMMKDKLNENFEEFNKNESLYFAQREERINELENLYNEKLKLEAPAKYWETLEKEYSKRGKTWAIVSGIIAAVIVLGLLRVLYTLPNIVTVDSHWIDVLKNSAIITVIASVAVYMLRMFVKLMMSSFHLARDAKERNNLSYFYLALIEKGAVTEKERAIILNALFSRADTGLLKGDSTPVMSSNVTELVEALNNR